MSTDARPSLVGAAIREARHSKGLTLAQVGARLGSSTGYLSNLETGVKAAGPLFLVRLADALELPVVALDPAASTQALEALLAARLGVTHPQLISALAAADAEH